MICSDFITSTYYAHSKHYHYTSGLWFWPPGVPRVRCVCIMDSSYCWHFVARWLTVDMRKIGRNIKEVSAKTLVARLPTRLDYPLGTLYDKDAKSCADSPPIFRLSMRRVFNKAQRKIKRKSAFFRTFTATRSITPISQTGEWKVILWAILRLIRYFVV